ncbi:MAG TPA: hypothetical protein VHL11_15825 [Phototrophicaceae bacterium]|nr:hypothetical protein [Phototrophicaceae bacterium]
MSKYSAPYFHRHALIVLVLIVIIMFFSGVSRVFAVDADADVDTVQVLPYEVVDVEYSEVLDRLIIVDTNNRLHIYDPHTGQDTAITLIRPATSVSVGPDGLFAAIGHDAMVSYVNLQTAVVEKELDSTANVGDLVLAGNGFIYVMPLVDQWEAMHVINIAENTEAEYGIINAGSVYRLHPDGNKLYGADRYLSPSDIHRALFEPTGEVTSIQDSPYHGDYPMCGDVWITSNGAQLITLCGTTLRASTDLELDMTYTGTLVGEPYIRFADDLASQNLVFGVLSYPAPERIWIWNLIGLNIVNTVRLPDFPSGDASNGLFIFVSTAQTQLYTVVKRVSDGQADKYGVVITDLEGITIRKDDLLSNSGFEAVDSATKLPMSWKVQGNMTPKRDKVNCKGDSAHEGVCAFIFKGNPGGGKTSLKQKISDTAFGIMTDQSTLNFSAYIDSKSTSPGTALGKVTIHYNDNSKDKLILKVPDGTGYSEVSTTKTLDLVNHDILSISASFVYKETSGKLLLDDVSLTITREQQSHALPLSLPMSPAG